jgi:hypothetical protein
MLDQPTRLITREEMEALLDERFPAMPAPTRAACLSGTVLQLATGERYQAPTFDDPDAIHRVVVPRTKVGDSWIQ